jgi:hypothetical protein
MKFVSRILGRSHLVIAAALSASAGFAATPEDAQVTQIIREVKLLPSEADPRDALINDKVSEDTAVRTGDESRSELTFADLTITRLGANTIFSFNKAGRTANVDSGSILLRVPKNSGGGAIKNNAVTVAITGTTVIFEAGPDGASKLITLEGSSRLSFTNNPGQFRRVRAGQMLEVPAGATTLPMPVYIDLRELMRTHPLIVDFRPLPSQPLIMAVAEQRPPPRTPQRPPPSSPQGPPPAPQAPPPPPPTGPGPGPVGPGLRPTPTPKPFPSPTTHPIRTGTPTPSPTATARPVGTPRPTPTPRITPTPRPTATPRPSPTAKLPPKPTPTPRRTSRPTPTPKPTPSPVILRQAPSPTPKPTATRTNAYTPKRILRPKPTPPPGPR